MKGINRCYSLLALVGAIIIILFRLPKPAPPDWKLITVSFGGLTNRAGVPSAALSIQNRARSAVTVTDHYYVESPGMPSYAATNHIIGAGRRLATGTNMVVAAGKSRTLLIPVPSDGNHWRISLDFARANLQTKLAEFLRKPHGTWASLLPSQLQAIYIVRSAGCEVSVEGK